MLYHSTVLTFILSHCLLHRYSKCGSHVQRCLPDKLASTRHAATTQPVNETEPATNTFPLRIVGSSTQHQGAMKQERGLLSAENTAGAEGSVETPKALLKRQGTGSLSDLQAPGECTHEQKRGEMLNETSTDMLFSLCEDEIKELRHTSFS